MWLWFLVSFLGFFSINSYAQNTTTLNEIDVIGKLDRVRNSIVPSLGATQYNIGKNQIEGASQGDSTPFNQVVLRAPGVVQDSFGQLHVRGEHANLQYRINGVLLPEGITGFGQELDTRFIDNVSLINGSLPAQYGFRQAGVVDIHTKSGVFNQGGSASMYGGSYNTVNPSFTYGGSNAKKDINYYVTSSYLEDDLGIENPTGSHNPIHDQTQQGKAFAYASKVIDDISRVSVMLSGSHGDFQIPNNPGQAAVYTLTGVPTFDSSYLNERQTEQNYYAIVTYQKSIDDFNFQISAFNRESEVLFIPDINGDLIFNGTAAQVDNSIITNGLEMDASYILNDKHTLRAGGMITISEAQNENTSYVFPADSSGNQTSSTASKIVDNHRKQGQLYGIYLQDEWKPFEALTINYGGRFDQSYQYLKEYQFSPRVNAVYEVNGNTKVHAGYSRYFTPPPLELVQNPNIHIYDNTTNFFSVKQNDSVKSERAHYFDLGATHDFLLASPGGGPGLQMGWDGYYKIARNQLDDGQFGQAVITTPFNYAYGKVYGCELTANYKSGDFSAYSNMAFSRALGKKWSSEQFHFTADDLAWVDDHWINLDHDSTLSGSAGVSYTWHRSMVYADVLYGSGLRKSTVHPNDKHVGGHNPVNIGIEHTFKLNTQYDLKVRFDVVNLLDEVYQIRSGSGVGVQEPQYGERRGFFGGVTLDF